MRCSCRNCGTYMIQADSAVLGCVCPDCGTRCQDCLGTDTVVRRDQLASLALDPRFSPENLQRTLLESMQGNSEEETDPYREGYEDFYDP